MEDMRTLCFTTVRMGEMEGEDNTQLKIKKSLKTKKFSVPFFNESLTLKADIALTRL